MADDDLEQTFRDGLHELGEGADVSAPVAANARAAAARRRRSRVAIVLAAASVAAISVAGYLVASGGSDSSEEPPLADEPSESVGVTEWRTEYWHDLQVDVPADWGWGTVPQRLNDDERLYFCGGPGAVVRADGRHEVNAVASLAYVGRPIPLSDACMSGDVVTNPEVPYAWFGADLPAGVVELGNGYTQETVAVGDTSLTVATRDERVRGAIIESARPTQGPCPDAYADLPLPGIERGLDDAEDLAVCAYAQSGNGYGLTYANVLDENAGFAFLEAAHNSQEIAYKCAAQDEDEFVVLRTAGLRFVVTFACPGIHQPDGPLILRLSKENVSPWAVAGVPATVGGPTSLAAPWPYDYFIGGLG